MKKPEQKQRRLVLNKERLRQLHAQQLVEIRGGAPPSGTGCISHDDLCTL